MDDINYYTQVCSRLTLQNKSLGFFKDLVNKIVPFVDLNEFIKCETDLARVAYCVQNYWDFIGAELIFRGKNAEESIGKRLEGNKEFSAGNYEKALLLFSQSIIKSPPSRDLALAYSNRSAVLQQLKEWNFCLGDIDLAFSHGYPDESRHKLYERMTACHIKLHNYAQAKIAAGLCQHYITKYNVTEEEYTRKLAKHLQNIEKCSKDETLISNLKALSSENMVSNSKFPSASAKLDVKYSEGEGRYAVAKEEVEAGETILEEEPFAKALLIERLESYCLNCFKKLRAAVACDTCSNVAFCSKSCKQQADKYHRYECRVFSLLMGSGMSVLPYLALRMVTQTTSAELLSKFARLNSRPDEITLDQKSGSYSNSDYETIYNLSALESQRKQQDFLERTIMAVFLVKCLRLLGYFEINIFKNPNATEGEIQVGAILLRNLQILQFNAYEITEFIPGKMRDLSKASCINLGLALYPTSAFFNHSCTPNVTRYFNGTKMIVISTEKIRPGQPILDNYGPLFTKMRRKERQYQLEGRYWFQCSCSACSEDWPTFENMNMDVSPKNVEEGNLLKKLQKLDNSLFEDGLKAMGKGDVGEAIRNLLIYINSAEEIINLIPSIKPYKSFYLAKEALKLCLPATKLNLNLME